MKSIIAKKDFTLRGKIYKKGQELKNIELDILLKLNEKGFINPIRVSDFQKEKIKKAKKEEE